MIRSGVCEILQQPLHKETAKKSFPWQQIAKTHFVSLFYLFPFVEDEFLVLCLFRSKLTCIFFWVFLIHQCINFWNKPLGNLLADVNKYLPLRTLNSFCAQEHSTIWSAQREQLLCSTFEFREMMMTAYIDLNLSLQRLELFQGPKCFLANSIA